MHDDAGLNHARFPQDLCNRTFLTFAKFLAPSSVTRGKDRPIASAGFDRPVIAGTTVILDGTGSSDPELDPLEYDWTISDAPIGSAAGMSDPTISMPSFTPVLEGIYNVSLIVSDFIGPGTPDTVEITAVSAEDFAQLKIVEGADVVSSLSSGQVTTAGNQNALIQFLSQAVVSIQAGDLSKAILKLENAIDRTDGCITGGAPDGNGPGRDWIIDCAAQAEVYALLSAALAAISP